MKLKQCPFCGGEAVIMLDELEPLNIKYLPCCETCDGMIEHWFSTEAEATAAWNRRANDG